MFSCAPSASQVPDHVRPDNLQNRRHGVKDRRLGAQYKRPDGAGFAFSPSLKMMLFNLRLDRAGGPQRWKTRIKETQSDPGYHVFYHPNQTKLSYMIQTEFYHPNQTKFLHCKTKTKCSIINQFVWILCSHAKSDAVFHSFCELNRNYFCHFLRLDFKMKYAHHEIQVLQSTE